MLWLFCHSGICHNDIKKINYHLPDCPPANSLFLADAVKSTSVPEGVAAICVIEVVK
jgi:hypothetical protein